MNKTQRRAIKLLKKYLKAHPSLRIGQALSNIAGVGDPYYLNDAEIVRLLK